MSPHILLVEDDDDSREILERLCAEEGYTVRAVASIEAALAALEDEEFDAVLTDCFVGLHRDEWETLRLLRAARSTPVIAHTGWPIDRDEALRRGFAEVLRKPVSLEKLLEALNRAAARSKR